MRNVANRQVEQTGEKNRRTRERKRDRQRETDRQKNVDRHREHEH